MQEKYPFVFWGTVFLFIALTMVSCELVTLDNSEPKLITASLALKELGLTFAEIAFINNGLLNAISEKALEQIDGDYNALYEDISSIKVHQAITSRSTETISLDSALRNKIASSRAFGDLRSSPIDQIPDFNIYYYAPDYKINYNENEYMIAVLDYRNTDQETPSVMAWDNTGKLHKLSVENPPNFPVLVLGISERIHRNLGNIEPSISIEPRSPAINTIKHDVFIKQVSLSTKEGRWDPWPYGRPELYVLFGIYQAGVKQYYDSADGYYGWLNGSYSEWTGNDLIFSIANAPEHMFYKVEFWDEDAGTRSNYGITGSFQFAGLSYNINASIEIKNDDDFMGSTYVSFYHPQDTVYSIGGIGKVKIAYTEGPL